MKTRDALCSFWDLLLVSSVLLFILASGYIFIACIELSDLTHTPPPLHTTVVLLLFVFEGSFHLMLFILFPDQIIGA